MHAKRISLSRSIDVIRSRPWRAALVLAYVLLGLAYILFRIHQPVAVLTNQVYDDQYFISQAQQIRAGEWLGPYGKNTLVKAPGYSYFLVLNNLLGTSYTLSLAVLHLVACAALVLTLVRTFGMPSPAGFLVFAALLLQPVSVPVRIYRDAFSDSLLLLTLAGVLTVLFGHRTSRMRALTWSGTGLALGLFWITREESIWLAPTLLAATAMAVFIVRREGRRALLGMAAAVAVVVVTATVPTLVTAGVNQAKYDTFVVNDSNRGPFHDLVAQLDRIGGVPELTRVPVPNEALAAAFSASPTFSTLENAFASPAVRAWALAECPEDARECGQIPGSIFTWALRDAAEMTGVYASAARTDAFYARAAKEIADACDRDYPCRPRPVSAIPVLTDASVSAFPGSVRRAIVLTLYQNGSVPGVLPSVDAGGLLGPTLEFLGDPPITTVEVASATPSTDDPIIEMSSPQEALADVYRVLTPVLIVLGAIAFVSVLAQRLLTRQRIPVLLAAAATLWIAYASRVGLIALVDATTFSSILPQYLEPAYLLACAAASTSAVAAAGVLRERVVRTS